MFEKISVFNFLTLALVCRMKISEAWYEFHTIAEIE